MSITVIATATQAPASPVASTAGTTASAGAITDDFAMLLGSLPAMRELGLRKGSANQEREEAMPQSVDPALLAALGIGPATAPAQPVSPAAASTDGGERALVVPGARTTLSSLPGHFATRSEHAESGNAEESAAKLAAGRLAERHVVADGFASLAGSPPADAGALAEQPDFAAPALPSPFAAVPATVTATVPYAPALKSDLPVPLHDAAWPEHLGEKLLWFAGNDQQVARLSLNPPELGALEVIVKVDATGANAHFVSANAEVRGAIENALPRLREMFAGAGIDLGQVSVGNGSSGQSSEHRREAAWQHLTSGDGAILAIDSTNRLPAAPGAMRQGSALVDVFA